MVTGDYAAVGFTSRAESRAFMVGYPYFAKKLTADEWTRFYDKFPEYYIEAQLAKVEHHPVYTAYAFRWATLQRKAQWAPDVIARLEQKRVQIGDDVFQLTYALGAPRTVSWTNRVEGLVYDNETAFIIREGRVWRIGPCPDCLTPYDPIAKSGPAHRDIEQSLIRLAQ